MLLYVLLYLFTGEGLPLDDPGNSTMGVENPLVTPENFMNLAD